MTDAKPNALAEWPELQRRIAASGTVVFLDYDGTLTPIAPRPELAVLSASMRNTLQCIANRWPTAIVTGRALDQILRMLDMPGLTCAGSHGFDIQGPHTRHQVGRAERQTINAAFDRIRQRTAGTEGILIENKTFSVAVHYRLVPPQLIDSVTSATREVANELGLRVTGGKSIIEMRPDLDWDKGRAVDWLAARHPGSIPLYIGDDVTDEDAFRAVRGRGIGIVVTAEPRETAASYSLAGIGEVEELLERLCRVATA